MAEKAAERPSTIDPKNGFCSETKIFHSIRPPVPLPPLSQPISITEYALSLLRSSTASTTTPDTLFLLDSATGHRLTYSEFLNQTQALAFSLQFQFPSLPKSGVAFILAPPSLHIPVLYFSLLSLGVTISPANPLSSTTELTHMLQLCKPIIVFTTSAVADKLPANSSLPLGKVLMDSPYFLSMLSSATMYNLNPVINQNDSAAILYSSGTTGRVKGVQLTHRNLIAVIADLYYNKYVRTENSAETVVEEHAVSLFPLPLFHVFGFFMLIRAASMGETLVLMGRFDFVKMLEAVEKYKVTHIPLSPPLVVALAKSELASKYNLSSLQMLASGGAPLGKEVCESFTARFPHVQISQGYGLTETGGVATRMMAAEEFKKYGSVGRLSVNMEAKIVDPDSKEALPPGKRGEIWFRGPSVMKGYTGDPQATSETLDSEGWLRTGDLCYFDSDGFLFIVDRLKELIKYKAYQVPPAELENVIQSIPGIADAAVIPYPNEEAGQIPMAYIVRKPGSNISENQIMDFVARQVAPYKKIRRVVFITAIPKSPAGKILRRELIEHALSAATSKL